MWLLLANVLWLSFNHFFVCSSVKPQDKREGGGQYNWGTPGTEWVFYFIIFFVDDSFMKGILWPNFKKNIGQSFSSSNGSRFPARKLSWENCLEHCPLHQLTRFCCVHVTKCLSDVNHKQNPKQAKANEVCRVEKTLCCQSDLDLTCSFVGCVWLKRTIITLTFDGPA